MAPLGAPDGSFSTLGQSCCPLGVVFPPRPVRVGGPSQQPWRLTGSGREPSIPARPNGKRLRSRPPRASRQNPRPFDTANGQTRCQPYSQRVAREPPACERRGLSRPPPQPFGLPIDPTTAALWGCTTYQPAKPGPRGNPWPGTSQLFFNIDYLR